ncbi:thiamine pyrophosphate TPP-binding domain-containing protein [Thermaerobacter marianensis DSM 12885]|uniref:Thiamine pyrophosphate TPP-binding domain-containing protein n=1 Tax=Thermaerobacter marianensis (strain ATCC 700841 / DSM 12885 / JCM 10246 / 7p75a) TaxID=644966 RepID=E6SIF6_THEM7|nr:thiamine pyrophosphate-requiring protein [Thermaerobacter marianensis]ADU51967.1 thiamine pyrophosphate TPP-binding domain-containing protein [Thermaerobacter marianensis DSM 12885]
MSRGYTTADALMEALLEGGVSYIFANLGSDHTAIIESWARTRANNASAPKVVISPHEMVALSAAHGYAQVTGRPQAVLVHVDCGTQNLGGAVHNAAKGRIPVLILAGAAPYTQEGERRGTRNEHIHWLQDVFDQRGIVREYMKYNNEIRTGKNVKQLVLRALQIAKSEPKGPVYLLAPREVLEEETVRADVEPQYWDPIAPSALSPEQVTEIGQHLVQAKRPLIVTSYLGRNVEAVAELVKLSERLAIPVLESVPNYVNFPANHVMHVGYLWNSPSAHPMLIEADFILVMDSDIPWIPLYNRPRTNCTVYCIDIDPLKEKTPLWYIPALRYYRVDSLVALRQLNAYLESVPVDAEMVSARFKYVSDIHSRQRREWKLHEKPADNSAISPEFLTACIREVIDDETIVLTETITNYEVVSKHLPRNKPGTLFASGASSLGWSGGAAIGVKLAVPEATVVSLTGDGSYLFSNPTTVYWMARKYCTPFLTVIYNNGGWRAPQLSTLSIHSRGYASRTPNFWSVLTPPADLAKVAEAAGGAYAHTVQSPSELLDVLTTGLQWVRRGRSAVIDVRIQPSVNLAE